MLKNWIRIFHINTKKEILYSVIKVGSLTLALSSCFFILVWFFYEQSYDRFHDNYTNTYRIIRKVTFSGNKDAFSPTRLYEVIPQSLPEVENATRYLKLKDAVFNSCDTKVKCSPLQVDPAFFDIFKFPLERGSLEKTFDKFNSIILTKKIAALLFKDKDPIGEVLDTQYGRKYVVTGVLSKKNTNTHMRFDVIIPISKYKPTSWETKFTTNYIQLNPGKYNRKNLEKKINELAQTYNLNREEYSLQPLKDIYLHSDFDDNEFVNYGNLQLVRIFLLAFFIILATTSVNYINITILSWTRRNKELGLRKILGSKKYHSLAQFAFETFLSIIIAGILATVIVVLTIPLIRGIFPGYIFVHSILRNTMILFVMLLIIIAITSLYLTFYFGSFSLVDVLSGNLSLNIPVRKIFLGFQILVSFIILVFSMNINRQMEYIKSFDVGMDIKNVIVVPINSYYKTHNLKDQLSQIPGIENVALSTNPPINFGNTTYLKVPNSTNKENENIEFVINCVDENFINLFGIQLIEGRNFRPIDENRPNGSNEYIINKTGLRALGLKDPIGKYFEYGDGSKGKIVGVIEDFNFKPLTKEIQPLILAQNTEGYFQLLVKTSSECSQSALDKAKDIIINIEGDKSNFEYNYLEDLCIKKYRNELFMSNCFTYFAIICILVCLFGFFSISSFVIKTKEKDVAIRKVYGAKRKEIVQYFIRDFSDVVIISLLLAIPVALLFSHLWLQYYAYKKGISYILIVIFLLGFILTLTGLLIQRSYAFSKLQPSHIIRNS